MRSNAATCNFFSKKASHKWLGFSFNTLTAGSESERLMGVITWRIMGERMSWPVVSKERV